MRLAQFIDEARDQIVAESVRYAADMPVLDGHAIDVLRDHLPLLLETIALDMRQPQTRAQSIARSEGRGPAPGEETAAQAHGLMRARSGLTIEQVVAEYRALRSSVLRLWADAHDPDDHAIADTLRFNEAVDQAVAESVAFFSAELHRWRSLFLGVLGHDLRGPLNAMLLTVEVLDQVAPEGTPADCAKALLRSGRQMQSLLDALRDYSKSELGIGMAVHRTHVDVAALCQDEADLLRTALPRTRIVVETRGATSGHFDGVRVREALANLVFHAAQHGTRGSDVGVRTTGDEQAVELSVDHVSDPIPPELLQTLFEPLRRYAHADTGPARNLGLGPFIVREVARAHGGDVTVGMGDGRVRFTMRLPKMPPA